MEKIKTPRYPRKGFFMGSDTRNKKGLDLLEKNRKAETLIEAGDLPSAAKILVDIVSKNPENCQAFNNMGVISWQKGAYQEAYTTFMHACDLKPDYVDALINLFDASLKLRKIKEVLPVLKRALGLIPDNEEMKVIVESIEDQGDQIYTSERAMRVLKKCGAVEENQRNG